LEKGFPKPKILIQNEVDELKLVKNLKKAKASTGPKEEKPKDDTFDVNKILDDFKRKRAENIKKRRDMINLLLEQYQDKLILEEDPLRRMSLEKQVEKQQSQILATEKELKELFK